MSQEDASDIEELQRRKDVVWKKFDIRHICSEHLAFCSRQFTGGGLHYVYQCSVCGEQRGGPISKARAALLATTGPPAVFDEVLAEKYRQERIALAQELKDVTQALLTATDPETAAFESEQQRAREVQSHRVSQAIDAAADELRKIFPWHRRYPVIIERLKTHAEVFRDPLAKPFARFSSERELRQWLDTWLAEDFEVMAEVPGTHLTEHVKVKIDYVLLPKEHLVKAGFKAGPVGLEVKYLRQEEGFSAKASRFIWQSVSYTDCEFHLAVGSVRLPRVLIFSNISFDNERSLLKGIEPYPTENDRAKWSALLELANHANVGSLDIYGTREESSGWKITFAGGTYFKRTRAGYFLSDPNLFEKVRIGNF